MKRAIIWKAVSSRVQAQDDKISLSFQEEQARVWCEANDYEVVAVLEVPGHSRSEADIVGLFEEYAKQGMFAYHELRQAWTDRSFDVLVAYSFDRLGRSNTLLSWVVENIIRKGMEIYLLEDGGYITEEDFRFKMAMGGIAITSPMDTLRKKTKQAKTEMVKKGLPTGSKLPLSHKLIRDTESGKTLRLVIDETYRPLYHAIAQLLIDRVPWHNLGIELEKLGFLTPQGKRYSTGRLYYMIYNPRTWGHNAEGYSNSAGDTSRRWSGRWIFDEYDSDGNPVPVPDDVFIARNVIPPMYEGELAEQLKAELRRRMKIRGNRGPNTTWKFSGLFICGSCGYSMTVVSKHGIRRGMRCYRAFYKDPEQRCQGGNRLPIKAVALQEFVHEQLEHMLNNTDIAFFDHNTPHIVSELEMVQDNIHKTENQIDRLIAEQSDAPDSIQSRYRRQIANLAERLEQLQEQESKLAQATNRKQHIEVSRRQTLEEIRDMTLEKFWDLPDAQINQHLHRLLGELRFVVVDRQVAGFTNPQS